MTDSPLRFFLLIGQSNMSGRGELADLEPEGTDNQEIFQFRSGRWIEAQDPLQDPNDPVYAVKADSNGGVGPGLSFAKSMREVLETPIGLLLCAKGGGGIRTWAREGELHKAMLDRLSLAINQGQLMGVLVHVGEGDSDSEESAEDWSPRFKCLVEGIRRDTDCPNLPFVFSQVGSISPQRRLRREHGYRALEHLRRVQQSVNLENVAMVPSADLPFKSDGLHLSTTGQITLGHRFAMAMQELLPDRIIR
ncbi:MAG: hypothetical protein COA62_11755 [Rhodobiaceae bacterium]|nr:MAG: hypothetical protein COA62_11755 [Rhodobiaceae bacterium]